jgi:hypothetical protein
MYKARSPAMPIWMGLVCYAQPWSSCPIPEKSDLLRKVGSFSPDDKFDSFRARIAMSEYRSFKRFKSSSLKPRLMNAF